MCVRETAFAEVWLEGVTGQEKIKLVGTFDLAAKLDFLQSSGQHIPLSLHHALEPLKVPVLQGWSCSFWPGFRLQLKQVREIGITSCVRELIAFPFNTTEGHLPIGPRSSKPPGGRKKVTLSTRPPCISVPLMKRLWRVNKR